MIKIVLQIDAQDPRRSRNKADSIVRRVLWPVVPRKGEMTWVSECTDCAYPVERVTNFLIRNGYVQLSFKAPGEDIDALLAANEGWRDADRGDEELSRYMHWIDDL